MLKLYNIYHIMISQLQDYLTAHYYQQKTASYLNLRLEFEHIIQFFDGIESK